MLKTNESVGHLLQNGLVFPGLSLLAFFFCVNAGIYAQQPGAPNFDEQAPVAITVGHFSAPARSVKWFERELEAFRNAHPQISVRAIAIRHPTRAERPLRDIRLLPNVFSIDSESGYEIPYLVDNELILPLDDTPLFDERLLQEFPERSFDAVSYRDHIWGIPWLMWNIHLVYRPDDFQEVGLAGPPKTWEDFLKYSTLLGRPAGGGEYKRYGACLNTDDETIPFITLSMIMQQGADIMANDRISLDENATSNALSMIGRIVSHKDVALEKRNPAEVVLNNFPRAAMYVMNTRHLPYLTGRKELALAPLPSIGSSRVNSESGAAAYRKLYFAIRRSSPQQEAASARFVQWMTRQDISIPTGWEGYPVRTDFTKREDFQDLSLNGPMNLEEIYDSMRDARDPGGFVEHRLLAFAHLWKHLAPILEDSSAASQAIQNAELEANRFLEENN